jgi:hypothetical protein
MILNDSGCWSRPHRRAARLESWESAVAGCPAEGGPGYQQKKDSEKDSEPRIHGLEKKCNHYFLSYKENLQHKSLKCR